jgi:hypothetical protein
MVWTLVYIIMTQGGGGAFETQLWESGLRFPTQQACSDAATKAAPDLLKAPSSYFGPNPGVVGPNPNAVTIRPACLPTEG